MYSRIQAVPEQSYALSEVKGYLTPGRPKLADWFPRRRDSGL